MRLIDSLTGHAARIALDEHPTSYRRTPDATFVLCEVTDPAGPVSVHAIDLRDLQVVVS